MSIYYRATAKVMTEKQHFGRWMLGANTVLALATAGLFVATAAATSPQSRNTYALAGSLLTVCISFLLSVGFLVYGQHFAFVLDC